MFELIFGGAQAYQQVGVFIAALVCFGLGALIIGNAIYMRLYGLRVTGTIIGVIPQGGMYAPAYRYTAPDGRTREAQSDVSSGTIAGKETGRVVPLCVSPHNPARATQIGLRTADSIVSAVGAVMVLVSAWLGYTAITAYPVTPMTWIMAVCMLIFLGWHVRRSVIPRGKRPSIAEWKKRRNLGEGASLDLTRVTPIEEIVSGADMQRAAERQSRQSRTVAPIVGVMAVVLIGVAIYQGTYIARLEANGLRADGRVVSLRSEAGSGGRGSSYFPIVRYRTEQNAQVEFKDAIGSDPPRYRVGDEVTVLYLANDPNEAIIDRGVLWNWAIPALLLIGAALLIWLLIAMLRIGWRGANARLPTPGDADVVRGA
jgi:Protein of unknown function (DUF3592)